MVSVSDIQRNYERQWVGMSSRWLAYCYAVGRHPVGGFVYRGHDSKRAVTWIRSRVDLAQDELGVTQKNQAESQAVTDRLWRYAVEERKQEVTSE